MGFWDFGKNLIHSIGDGVEKAVDFGGEMLDPLHLVHKTDKASFVEKTFSDISHRATDSFKDMAHQLGEDVGAVQDEVNKAARKELDEFLAADDKLVKMSLDQLKKFGKDTGDNVAGFVQQAPFFSSLGLGATALTVTGVALGGLIIILIAIRFIL